MTSKPAASVDPVRPLASRNQLRESVGLIRNLMRLAPDVVFTYSLPQRRLTYVNQRLTDVLGYTVDDLTDLNDASLAQLVVSLPSDRPEGRWTRRHESLPDGQSLVTELTVRHKNGSERILRVRSCVCGRDRAGVVTEILGIAEDITVERQAKEELRRSEAFTRRILDLCPDAIGVYDVARQQMQYIGRSLWETLGFTTEEAQAMNLKTADYFWDEAERGRAFERLDEFKRLPDGATHTFKTKMRHRAGSAVYVLVRGMVFERQPDGTATELIAFYQDVTEQEKATERLQIQRDLLLESEQNFQYGSWDWDLTRNEVRWSEGLFNLYGLNSAEYPDGFIPIDLYRTYLDPGDFERIGQGVEAALRRTEGYETEHWITDAQGRRKLLQARGKVFTDDQRQPVKVLGTTTDVTQLHAYETELARRIDELHRINRDLRRSETLLAQTETQLHFGSWEWNVASDSAYWSDGHYRLFGYSDPATRPASISFELHLSHLVDPDEAQATGAKIQHAAETGEGFSYEYRVRGADGIERQLRGQASTERDETGRIVKLIGSTTDVTQLREYETQLQAKIDALNRSNRELEQFAYVASHDLQEPLRKITAFGERLTARLGTQLGPEGTLYLDRMLDAAARMRVLINDLLNFSRLTRQNEPFVRTNLNEVFRSVLSDLEIKIQERDVVVDWEPLPTIQAVPSQMRQLFQNLLSNALKFSRPDVPPRIRMEVEAVSASVRSQHSLEAGRRYVALVFQDNGIGFESEFAERIFVLFQRLHGRSEYEGTGIGLAICRKIVDHHQGRIFAESQPDQGARFTIILPVHH